MQMKDSVNSGTVEQVKYSMRAILIDLYIEQYGLKGKNPAQRECEIQNRNNELLREYEKRNAKQESRDKAEQKPKPRPIPLETHFIRERRKWFERLIDLLIEDGAYDAAMKEKKFVYTKSSGLKDFINALLLSGVEKNEEIRTKIRKEQYSLIEDEDVQSLRSGIKTLYEEAGYNEEEVDIILEKFDSHFPEISPAYKEVQKELFDLNSYLGTHHYLQFTDDASKKISVKLRELNEYVESLMKWDPNDQLIIQRIYEENKSRLQKKI